MKAWVAAGDPRNLRGSLGEPRAMEVFVATARDIRRVFARVKPVPDSQPELAARHARVMGTGRSAAPNQIKNVLVFPGVFRGRLDARAGSVDDEMRLAAEAIAAWRDPAAESVFNKAVAPGAARAVARAAHRTGAARGQRRVALPPF